jgi:hypothetical protein
MLRRIVARDVVAHHVRTLEIELRNERSENIVARVYRPERFGPCPQPGQGGGSNAGKGIIRSPAAVFVLRMVIVRWNRSMQPFQFVAPRRSVETEDRGEVSRLPLRLHYSRFEQPLLVFLSQSPSDGARLFQGPDIVSNTCPELRALQHPADDAKFGIERCWPHALCGPPRPRQSVVASDCRNRCPLTTK